MSEGKIDIGQRMQQMGNKFNEYKDAFASHFKDMEVEVREWNFAVGKSDAEYNVDIRARIIIRPKKA